MTVLDVREHEEQQLTSPDEEPLILAAIETHSIDVIPDKERHGTIRQQGVFWFLSNTQTLSVAVGFIGIARSACQCGGRSRLSCWATCSARCSWPFTLLRDHVSACPR